MMKYGNSLNYRSSPDILENLNIKQQNTLKKSRKKQKKLTIYTFWKSGEKIKIDLINIVWNLI